MSPKYILMDKILTSYCRWDEVQEKHCIEGKNLSVCGDQMDVHTSMSPKYILMDKILTKSRKLLLL